MPAIAKRVDMLTPEAVADSIRIDNARFVPALKAQPELEFFFSQLLAKQPALVGGKLPDAGFYSPVGTIVREPDKRP